MASSDSSMSNAPVFQTMSTCGKEKSERTTSNSRPNAAHTLLRARRPWLDRILESQIQLAMALIIGMAMLSILSPRLRRHTRKCFSLSYETPTVSGPVYLQGIDDVHFVLAWIVYFTALRAIVIDWLLQPLARILGVMKKSHLRFAEQGWIFLYYSTIWVLGMSLWVNSKYWLSHAELWTAWPAREMSGQFKLYYLIQLAFSAQLLLAIHMEARRKDYVEMLTHHIVTCSLISITYVYRYTRAANVVLCLMDFVDILLPFAKLLRYLRYEMACNIAFGVFVVSWFITRHVLFLQLWWNTYTDVPGERTMMYGCYNGATSQRIPEMPSQPDYFSHLLWPLQDLEGIICLNTEVKYIFLGMLFLLHTLSSIWFVMILKVIARILSGKPAEDIRSDDEEGQQEEPPIESLNPCTGSASELLGQAGGSSTSASMFRANLDKLNPCTGEGTEVTDTVMEASNMSKRPGPTTTRRRLIGAENRKELLSRIGCEKPI
ncbi:TLC domain-containing protein [Rhexocercosporidium sp. MPI-PUGE-AT-0058]|nr:TLC domain-containing protein [Rhexocercosporidium sp. MPI-PUGE-AT-0058]